MKDSLRMVLSVTLVGIIGFSAAEPAEAKRRKVRPVVVRGEFDGDCADLAHEVRGFY
jgi:hypothetical protein